MTQPITRSPHVWNYEEIDAGGEKLRELFKERNIKISEHSALSKLLNQAARLSKEWESRSAANHTRTLVDSGHANRIIQAVIKGASDPGSLECMKRIANKDVDLSQRAASQGKDALWELEFLAMLKSKGVKAHLSEPDIVANFLFDDCSIACKKVYSDEGRAVESQVRAGAKQIERSGRPGIVALNIDDLVPAHVLVKAKTTDAAMDALANLVRSFLDRHQMRVQRFVKDGRIDGIVISVTVPSDIEMSSPNFNQLVQMTLWSLETASIDARARMGQMRIAFKDIIT
ncbi:hypothetical protein [Massilia psychrophila]|uniref:Uncharacterized protein n=1 Tax=Massilia psychrophila TaxID=1603353 RepID=A0A2G8SZG2_9BURK|nr:hypothetical protein [Massilia psychrophila]PIL39207.1 hypothetical protein CR103_14060 [Massilia psychrophila]GGE82025.1 hypothetical protein GCM10008020_28690 [Massilia psychrophila]